MTTTKKAPPKIGANAKSQKPFFKMHFKQNAKVGKELISTLAQVPAHRWLPSESLILTGHGYITKRQANWLIEQMEKAQVKVEFTIQTLEV